MAKLERGAKSGAVRSYLEKHPEAGPSVVVAELRKKGIKVTPALVSNIKTKLSGNPSSGKSKSASRKPAAQAASNGATLLHTAAVFSKECGGIENARELLTQLEALLSV